LRKGNTSSAKGAGKLLASSINTARAAVATAIGRYRRSGRPVTGQEAAWLTVVLRDLRVRDDAWARMDPAHTAAHLRLWTDLTRRARARARPGSGVAAGLWYLAVRNGSLANEQADQARIGGWRFSVNVPQLEDHSGGECGILPVAV